MICNHNGLFIDPDDPIASGRDGAWLFGDTLFETMKGEHGQISFLHEHLDRIETSARLINFPIDRERIIEALTATMQQAGPERCRIRLTLSRGDFASLEIPPAARGHFLIQASPAKGTDEDEQRLGVRCVLAPNRRVNPLSHLPQMKRGNYVDCLYAAQYARSKGAREALFVNRQGLLLEGATSNIFLIKDGTLVTPNLGELVLRGIIREQILKLAGEWGMRSEVREVPWDELFNADVLPVVEIDNRPIGKGPLTQKFLAALQNVDKTT